MDLKTKNAWDLVYEFFEGDEFKTARWFTINNPLLGGMSPLEMIETGRYDKLIKFIKNCLDGNFP